MSILMYFWNSCKFITIRGLKFEFSPYYEKNSLTEKIVEGHTSHKSHTN